MLADALQELEERVRREVLRPAGGGERPPQLELARHAEDYRTWRRMGEAPAHVDTLADTIGPALTAGAPVDRAELVRELVAMLERIYRDLASPGEKSAPGQDRQG